MNNFMSFFNTSKLIFSKLKKEESKMQNIFEFSDYLKKENIAPVFHHIESASTEPEVLIDGKKYLMFASNNYLGLSTSPEIIEASSEALKKHGLGPGGSRFLCGNIDILEKLDKKVAELVETEDAITFPTGYMANLGVFKAVMDPLMNGFPYKKGAGIIFSDEFNHGTIVDGCQLSSAKKIVFKHNDVQDLRDKLSKAPNKSHKMIVTEGVFSPEGGLGALNEIVDLANEFQAVLMVDDAHGIAVMGEKGGGTVQHLGLQNKVDIIMGSFDKALGGMGGFLAGRKELIGYLKTVCRPYIFSSAVSGVMAGGMIKAIEIVQERKELREKLFENSNYLRKGLKDLGFTVWGDGEVAVAPVIIGDESKAINFAEQVFKKGVFSPVFRWPAVPKNTSRARVTPMATHTREHLDRLLEVFEEVGKDVKLIK